MTPPRSRSTQPELSLASALHTEGPADLARERQRRLERARATLAHAERATGVTPTELPPPPSPKPHAAPKQHATPNPRDPLEADLQRLLGFPSFRPHQRPPIDAVLAGRDALAVLPTGGGKSLTYTLPALLLPGTAVVVSPLISLMDDQVAKLRAHDLPAATLHGHLPPETTQRTLDDLRHGRLKLIFVSPERLRSPRFLAALTHTPVSLLAVDEAHCVSQWGHDFRPDYRRLADAARRLGRPPILAVTATATPRVQHDIAHALSLRPDAHTELGGFDRPNLFLAAHEAPTHEAKASLLLQALSLAPAGPAIVYCGARKSVERLANLLQQRTPLRVSPYHAGLPPNQRAATQDALFADALDIVVATNAFGLGVDKSNIRAVIHHDIPGSLEAYYQEAGRAGRDGLPALCLLLHGPRDTRLRRYLIATAHPDLTLLQHTLRALVQLRTSNPARLRDAIPDSPPTSAIQAALDILDAHDHDLSSLDPHALSARADHHTSLLEHTLHYAHSTSCRRHTLLRYFGDHPPTTCDACDRCSPTPLAPPDPSNSLHRSTRNGPLRLGE